MSVLQERRCKRGGGYRMRAKSYRAGSWLVRTEPNRLETRRVSSQEKVTMKKLRMIGFAVLGLLLTAVTAAAQAGNQAAEGGSNHRGSIAIAAGIGFAIAVFGGALGQSKIGAAACEGAARNPGAAGRIQTMMILGLALIESLVLFALLIVFTVVKGA